MAAGAVFGGVALAVCSLLGLNKKQKTIISSAFAALGVALGAIFGIKILTKVAPKLVKWFKKLEKNIAFKFEGKECKFGIEFFKKLKVMLHRPHTTGLHKDKPINWHIQIEAKIGGRWKTVFKIEISTIINWIRKI